MAKFSLNQWINTDVMIVSKKGAILVKDEREPDLHVALINLMVSQTFSQYSCTQITSSCEGWGKCQKLVKSAN